MTDIAAIKSDPTAHCLQGAAGGSAAMVSGALIAPAFASGKRGTFAWPAATPYVNAISEFAPP